MTDNASGDGSVELLHGTIRARGWEGWAAVQPLERNGGFAWGNNQAIRPALASEVPPRYVLLLNPDTIVRPGALAAFVDFLDRFPEVGIAGGRLENLDGTPQWSAFRFHSVLGSSVTDCGSGSPTGCLRAGGWPRRRRMAMCD